MFDKCRVWQTPKSVQGTDKCTASSIHRGNVTEGQAHRDSYNCVISQWGLVRSTKTSYITSTSVKTTLHYMQDQELGVVQEFLRHIKNLFLASPRQEIAQFHHWNKPQHIIPALLLCSTKHCTRNTRFCGFFAFLYFLGTLLFQEMLLFYTLFSHMYIYMLLLSYIVLTNICFHVLGKVRRVSRLPLSCHLEITKPQKVPQLSNVYQA